MKKNFIFFLLILLSAFGYYKYTKIQRERLIQSRIEQIRNIDQNSLSSFLKRVIKTKKQTKYGIKLRPVRRRPIRRRRSRKYIDTSNNDAVETSDDSVEDEEVDDEEDEDTDEEDTMKPVATPRGRLKPLSPEALKKIRAAAEARMKELLERKRKKQDEEDEEEEEE